MCAGVLTFARVGLVFFFNDLWGLLLGILFSTSTCALLGRILQLNC